MGSSSRIITVTCDCGRDMRVARSLMGTRVSCPVCGASIDLPADPAAGVGPPCPHCGRPWPVDQSRCPACMARSRTRHRREDGEADEPGFSRRFAPITADSDIPGPQYEPTPTIDPLTVRVKHWYDKPTQVGWSVATAVTVLAALIALLHGIGAASGVWIGVGAAGLLIAVGLLRGNATARSAVVAGPLLIVIGGSIMALWLAPEALSWREALILTVIVAGMAAGLALLTSPHGTVGVVGLGAILATLGLIATCMAMATTGWHTTVTGQVIRGVRRGLADVGDTLTATRPAPGAQADVQVAEPDLPPPPLPQPAAPLPPVAAQPAPPPLPPPPPPPIDWRAAMAAAGFEVTFLYPGKVRATRQTVAVDGAGDCEQTAIAQRTATLDTRAIIYADVAADPRQAELIAVARHGAGVVGGTIDYQMWRNDRGPRVYYIRSSIDRDGRAWAARVESRRVGAHVIVLVGIHPKANRITEPQSWEFFKSFAALAAEANLE